MQMILAYFQWQIVIEESESAPGLFSSTLLGEAGNLRVELPRTGRMYSVDNARKVAVARAERWGIVHLIDGELIFRKFRKREED